MGRSGTALLVPAHLLLLLGVPCKPNCFSATARCPTSTVPSHLTAPRPTASVLLQENQGEGIQVLRYEHGQEYKPHFDVSSSKAVAGGRRGGRESPGGRKHCWACCATRSAALTWRTGAERAHVHRVGPQLAARQLGGLQAGGHCPCTEPAARRLRGLHVRLSLTRPLPAAPAAPLSVLLPRGRHLQRRQPHRHHPHVSPRWACLAPAPSGPQAAAAASGARPISTAATRLLWRCPPPPPPDPAAPEPPFPPDVLDSLLS